MKFPRIDTGNWLVGLTLVGLAVFLRVWRLGHGLPEFLEEALPYRTAFVMAGWESGTLDLNPHFFNYPSLTLYLQLLLQKIVQASGPWSSPADFWLAHHLDPSLPVMVGRLPGIAGDAFSVLAVWRLGERLRPGAGPMAGGLVALSAVMIETSRMIFVEPVMTAFMLWSLERMIAWKHEGGRGRLLVAVLLMGLAAGSKYNAGLLALPLAWVLWRRAGQRGLMAWPVACGGALVVFLATSPWVLLDFATFRTHFGFEGGHMASGHLGTVGRHGFGYLMRTLVTSPGLPAAGAAAMGLAMLVRRGTAALDEDEAVVWALAVPLFISVAMFRMEAARYVAPLVPLLAVTAALTASRLAATRPGGREAAAAILLLPVLWSGFATASTGSDNTRQRARRWIEETVPAASSILQETYGAPLITAADRHRVTSHPRWAEVSGELRRQFEVRTVHDSVELPMAASGSLRLQMRGPGGGVKSVTLFDHASDLNGSFYHPALYSGADWIVTSGAIRRRYEADPTRYAEAIELYAILDREAEVAARFISGGGADGPTVTIYRVTEQARLALALPFDALWWLARIPQDARREIEVLTVPAPARLGGALRDGSGNPAAWTSAMEPVFVSYYHPFLTRSLRQLYARERWPEVRGQCAAVLAIMPHDEASCLAMARASVALGDGPGAAAVLNEGVRARNVRGLDASRLERELGRLLGTAP